MGFRFWKRIKIAPGITVNLSKSGPSLSVGPRGAKVTVGRTGSRATVGIPGSGLFYTKKLSTKDENDEGAGAKKVESLRKSNMPPPPMMPPPPPPKGSPDEETFAAACAALETRNEAEAYDLAKRGAKLADGAFLAGYLALASGDFTEAEEYLLAAVEDHRDLGRHFDANDFDPDLHLPITDEVVATVRPGLRGALLGLVEVYQAQERVKDAIATLDRLSQLEPLDVVIKLSLMELLARARPESQQTWQYLIRLSKGIENDSAVHAAVLLYKGWALRKLEMNEAAREVLSLAMRKKKGRSEELLRAIRYQRALVYEALGDKRRNRQELERIYASDPDYEDVGQRLGL